MNQTQREAIDRRLDYWSATNESHRAYQKLRDAARTLIASLEWEEKRSGTTYNGFETLRDLVN